MMETFANRFQQALKIRNMKQSEIVEKTGTYLSGEYEPKQRNIYKIAEVLDVSEAWLMGYTDNMKRYNTQKIIDNSFLHDLLDRADKNKKIYDLIEKEYGSDTISLIRIYRRANETNRQKILDVVIKYSQLDDYDKGSITERLTILLEQDKYSHHLDFASFKSKSKKRKPKD